MKRFGPSYSSDVYSGGAPKKQKNVQFKKLNAVVTGVSDLGIDRSEDGHSFSVSLERAPLNIPAHASNVTARLTKAIIPNSWETATPTNTITTVPNYTETGESFTITQQQMELQKTWTTAQNDFSYTLYSGGDVPARTATRASESYNAMLSTINPGFYYNFEDTDSYIKNTNDEIEAIKPQHEQTTSPEGEMTMRFSSVDDTGAIETSQPFDTNLDMLTEEARNNGTNCGGLKIRAATIPGGGTLKSARGTIEGIEQLDTSGGITVIITGQHQADRNSNPLFWISDASDPSYTDGDTSFEILHGVQSNNVLSGVRELTGGAETVYTHGFNNKKFSQSQGDNVSYAVTIDADGNADVWSQQVKCQSSVTTSLNGPIASCGIGSIRIPSSGGSSGDNRTEFIFSKILLLPYHCDDYKMKALIDMMAAQTGCSEVNQVGSSVVSNDPADFVRYRQDQRAAIPVITMGDFSVHNWEEVANNYQGLVNYGVGLFDDMDAGTHQGFSTLVGNDRNQQTLRVTSTSGLVDSVPLATNIYNSSNSSVDYENPGLNVFEFDDDKLFVHIPYIRSRHAPDGNGNVPKKLSDITAGHYSFNINASDSYTIKMVNYIKSIKFSEEFAGFKMQDPTIIISIGEEEARGTDLTVNVVTTGDEYITALLEVVQYIVNELPRVQIIIAPPLPRLPNSDETPTVPPVDAYAVNAQICLYISETLGGMIPFQGYDNLGNFGGGSAPTMFPDTDAQRVRLMYHTGDFLHPDGNGNIRRYTTNEVHTNTTTPAKYFNLSTCRFGDTANTSPDNYALDHSEWDNTLVAPIPNEGLVYQLENFISDYYTAPDQIPDIWSGGHIALKYETGGNETERYGLISGKPANEWHIYKAPSWGVGQYFYTREEFFDRLIRDLNSLVDDEYSLGTIVLNIEDYYTGRQFRMKISSPIQAGTDTKLSIDLNYYLTGEAKRNFINQATPWEGLIFQSRLDAFGNQNEKWINYQFSNYVDRTYTIDVPTNLYYDQNNINSITQEAIAMQWGKNGSKVTTDEPFLWIPDEKSVWNYQLTYSGYAQIGARMTKINMDDVFGAKTTWDFTSSPVFKELLKLPLSGSNIISIDPGLSPLRLSGSTSTANRGGTEYYMEAPFQFTPIDTSAGVSPLLATTTTSTEVEAFSGTPIFLVTDFTQGGVNQRGDRSQMIAMIPTTATPGNIIIYDASTELPVSCGVTLKGKNPQSLQFRLLDKNGEPIPVGGNTSWAVQVLVEWEQEVQEDYLLESDTDTKFY